MLKEISNDIHIESFAGQITAVNVFCPIYKAAIFGAEHLILRNRSFAVGWISTVERKIISIFDFFKFDPNLLELNIT